MRSLIKNKKAVVWVSTVLYTLIGLSIIAMLLAVLNPKIKEMKDSFVVKQTIVALGDFDDIIPDIKKATGNRRLYELYLSQGNFVFDCVNNKVEWTLEDSDYAASEIGVPYQTSNIIITTQKVGDKKYSVNLKIDYSPTDLTCGVNEDENEILLQPASASYRIYAENKGSSINIALG